MQPPYRSTPAAYAEIVPALVRQTRDPTDYVVRPVPDAARA